MESIRLTKDEWEYDPNCQLAPEGGFGAVFKGRSVDGIQVAVKRLKIEASEAGHRELRIAEELVGKPYKNVLHILDSGMDAESGRYFIVMPLAEGSLQEHIPHTGINESEAIKILSQIANGLKEVQHLVHRDLKPANILLHDGEWKIADFGIARFVEKSTSIKTLKKCLTPQYAAPEQWKLETCTNLTDIYALGCIAYALIAGNPPFAGNAESLQNQHLTESPAPLSASHRLNQLILMCLRKNPKARPSLTSVIQQINKISSQSTQSISLARAANEFAREKAQKNAQEDKLKLQELKRKDLAKEALDILRTIIKDLFNYISTDAPIAEIGKKLIEPPNYHIGKRYRREEKNIRLGAGCLRVRSLNPFLHRESLLETGVKDIVCGALIAVDQAPSQEYIGRSANLWFGNIGQEDDYRWWEVAYFKSVRGYGERCWPFGLDYETDIQYSLNHLLENYNLAAPPIPIDGENFEDFVQRWSEWLAKASCNQLLPPRYLPEK